MAELVADDYQRLLAVARRHSRVAGEADDLLHDALCVAAERGRLDVAGADGAWLAGVIAQLALRRARDAVRRKRREESHLRPGATETPPLPDAAFLRELPPSARRVAVLALNGMTPAELRHVLRLSETAYRQRLTTIRRAWRSTTLLPVDDPAPAAGLDLGLIRQALLDPARRRGLVASHDPDGNLFLLGEVSRSHPAPPRQQDGVADA